MGVRLPLHLFFLEILEYVQISPFQLHPNAWRQMIRMLVIYHQMGFQQPTAREFFYVFDIKSNPDEYGFYYASRYQHGGIRMVEGLISNVGNWKGRFFFNMTSSFERGEFVTLVAVSYCFLLFSSLTLYKFTLL